MRVRKLVNERGKEYNSIASILPLFTFSFGKQQGVIIGVNCYQFTKSILVVHWLGDTFEIVKCGWRRVECAVMVW